jgi:hypothetical protein
MTMRPSSRPPWALPSQQSERPGAGPTNREPELHANVAERQGNLVVLAGLWWSAGAALGRLGAVFRLVLEQADRFQDAVLAWAPGKAMVSEAVLARRDTP